MKHIPTIFLFLIILYFSQNVLYVGGGSLIAQSSLFLIILLSSIYTLHVIADGKNSTFVKIWFIFLILNIFGYIFTSDLSSELIFDQWKGILIVLLPFFPIYYFTRHNLVTRKHLIIFFTCMTVITMSQFYFNRDQIIAARIKANFGYYSPTKTDLVNNVTYAFVFLLPFIFFIRNRIISFLVILLFAFFVLQGAKRGAIIAASLGIIFYLIYIIKNSNISKTKSYLFVAVGLILIIYLGNQYYQSNAFLAERFTAMAEGDSSGRQIIYQNLVDSWMNANFIELFFGFGLGSSLIYSQMNSFAHNDWIELLVSYGLLGVIIYLCLFISAVKLIRKSKDYDQKFLLVTIVSIWLFTTLISMNFMTTDSIFQTILLGYVVGKSNVHTEPNLL